jgi:hypothetical protein
MLELGNMLYVADVALQTTELKSYDSSTQHCVKRLRASCTIELVHSSCQLERILGRDTGAMMS